MTKKATSNESEASASTDVLTPAQRAFCMSHNRGKDTKPEILLRSACHALGLRHRLKANIPGRPDFVYMSSKVAVFVDGCFWHACPVHYQAPKTRAEFWNEKRQRNRARDEAVNALLIERGWVPFRVWEHDVKADVEAVACHIAELVRERSRER
ncbi:very short patch repair endonuclease [Trinickia soli]|uniref:very short patch repair endonuclease n=1 Tax=Trinickia soli TaxID=380675 RepID=UPI00125C6F7D|nr:DNA mismatch endonuclease Vsr [Paraburkholderia sp. T12-10]